MNKSFLIFGYLFLINSICAVKPTLTNEMYRNQYGSPYSSGSSYRSGSQDCNDVSNTYGRPLGGPTLWCDDGTYLQCDNYGTCHKAF